MRAVASSVQSDRIAIACRLLNGYKYLSRASASVRLDVRNVDNRNAASSSDMDCFFQSNGFPIVDIVLPHQYTSLTR